MANTFSIQRSFGLGGKAFADNRGINGSGVELREQNIPAAQGGSLTTRTNNTAGTITMTSGGHTITTGQRVSVFWTGGQRRGVTVGTVSGTAVPISGGSGDNLPTQGTAVAVNPDVSSPLSVVWNNVLAFAVVADGSQQSIFVIADATPTEQYFFVAAGSTPDEWDSQNGKTNPLAGSTSTQIFMSHGDATAAHLMRIGVLLT